MGQAISPDAARRVRLRYVSDEQAGLHRRGRQGGFRYEDAAGHRVKDAKTLARIKSLVIPPAWTDVWICRHADGHLQAVGRDARGRKQYRYHPQFRLRRDGKKFHRMVAFGRALPRIRRRVAKDLRGGDSTEAQRNQVLALAIRLMDVSGMRVGNEEYARQNKSFGLTTLKNRHVQVRGKNVRFHFVGKSGVEHEVTLSNRRLAKLVRHCQELPGQELFQYRDESGHRHKIGSGDVNAYLREIAGDDFTAKDFRTWRGSTLAVQELMAIGPAETATQAKRELNKAIKEVSADLGNTAAVCRSSYIHPVILSGYADLKWPTSNRASRTSSAKLSKAENELLRLLSVQSNGRKKKNGRAHRRPR
jgi:DNA topoisomerase-1